MRKIICLLLMLMAPFAAQAQYYPENRVPQNHCILTIASRPSLDEAVVYIRQSLFVRKYFPSMKPYAHAISGRGFATHTDVGFSIYRSVNGWYAISMGTTPKLYSSKVLEAWREYQHFPTDAFCSDGANYVEEFFPIGKPVLVKSDASKDQSVQARKPIITKRPEKLTQAQQGWRDIKDWLGNWGKEAPSDARENENWIPKTGIALIDGALEKLAPILAFVGGGYLVFLLLITLGHFLPTIICMMRDGKRWLVVLILNVFLGWTGIGWVLLLIYAVL